MTKGTTKFSSKQLIFNIGDSPILPNFSEKGKTPDLTMNGARIAEKSSDMSERVYIHKTTIEQERRKIRRAIYVGFALAVVFIILALGFFTFRSEYYADLVLGRWIAAIFFVIAGVVSFLWAMGFAVIYVRGNIQAHEHKVVITDVGIQYIIDNDVDSQKTVSWHKINAATVMRGSLHLMFRSADNQVQILLSIPDLLDFEESKDIRDSIQRHANIKLKYS